MIEYHITDKSFTLVIPAEDGGNVDPERILRMIKAWRDDTKAASSWSAKDRVAFGPTPQPAAVVPPQAAEPDAPDPLKHMRDDLDPVVTEKLLRGAASNQENLNHDEFELFLVWLRTALKAAFTKPFTYADVQGALERTGVVVRPGAVQAALRVLAESERLKYTPPTKLGDPIIFTNVDTKE